MDIGTLSKLQNTRKMCEKENVRMPSAITSAVTKQSLLCFYVT